MKEFIYSVYALFFNIYARLFKVKKNRVALVSMHNEGFKDALGSVYEELKKRGNTDFVFISRQDLEIKARNIFRVISFFVFKSFKLATAQYVYLNDNFLPMSVLNIKNDTTVVQLWHAEGVFKKFGFAIPQEKSVRESEKRANEKIDFVVCSSKAVAPYYAEAFGIDESRVLPLGSPRADYFFTEGKKEEARKSLEGRYPVLKGKKVVLYAPTFRDTREENEAILGKLDPEGLCGLLGDGYALLVKLHPQIHTDIKENGFFIDATDYEDVRELISACDILVTDYSSICMDFALLNKKTVFFAYDLEKYTADRDFYFDYLSYIPGKAVRTTKELAEEIKAPFDEERNEKFVKFNFDFFDGESARRVVDRVES